MFFDIFVTTTIDDSMSEEEVIEVTRELLNDAPRETSAPPAASNGRVVRTPTRISAARLEAMQVAECALGTGITNCQEQIGTLNKRIWWKKMTFESPDDPDAREELRVGQLLFTWDHGDIPVECVAITTSDQYKEHHQHSKRKPKRTIIVQPHPNLNTARKSECTNPNPTTSPERMTLCATRVVEIVPGHHREMVDVVEEFNLARNVWAKVRAVADKVRNS